MAKTIPYNFTECEPKERLARWEHVIKVLQKLTPHERRKHFNMRTFGEKTPCGTVACAAGWAGMDRWFRSRGFKLDFERFTYKDEDGETRIGWDEQISPVDEFFGHEGTDNIFYDSSQRSVGEVIKEIKEHIAKLKAEMADEETA